MQGAQSAETIPAAVRRLARGGLVAYPTETVWGLAADAWQVEAVGRLRRWKGRDDSQPISVLVSSVEDAEAQGFEFTSAARLLAKAFWPGPLTLVAAGAALPWVGRGDGGVGLRCSSHPSAARLAGAARAAGLGPLTATSFNPHAAPAARCRAEAERVVESGDSGALGSPALLEGLPDAFGAAPSTVIDVIGGAPRVLRWGAVTRAAIAAILSTPGGFDETSASPGQEPT